MQDLQRMGVFAIVAEELSLSKAAAKLGCTKSAVSRQLSALEQSLDVKLLYRSTRRSRLTDEGEALLPLCTEILQRYRDVQDLAEQLNAEPAGRLTLEMPESFAPYIVLPELREFQQRYPLINLDLRLRHAALPDISEDLDVCLLSGYLPDSSVVCRKIADQKLALYASADYIEQYGRPKNPQQLRDHRCIAIDDISYPETRQWIFHKKGQLITTEINPETTVNHIGAAKELVLGSMGISVFQAFSATEEVASGKLVPLLTSYELERIPLYILYPDRKHLSPKIRAMVDFLVECFEHYDL